MQKLVGEQGVDVIEGIFFSSILLGVRDTIDQLKVPTVVANAAANAISRDRKSDYIWRTSYSNYQLGVPLGPWAAQRDRQERRRRDHRQLRGGAGVGSRVQGRLREGGRRRSGRRSLTPFPVTPDYQPYFQQAADSGAKGVWAFTAGGGEAIKFVKTYKQFGFDKQFQLFGSNNMTDPQSVLDAQGDAAIGIRTTANWAPTLKNKENVLFLKQYDKFGVGEPSAFAELGYVAAQFLDLAAAEGARRHQQQGALPRRDGEHRHLAVAGRQADDGSEDAQRGRACLPPQRRQARVGLHAAARRRRSGSSRSPAPSRLL